MTFGFEAERTRAKGGRGPAPRLRRAVADSTVAAGIWYLWVRPGVYACDMAAALPGTVVLEPLGQK
ncbi:MULTISPECIES: hypothetical protein [unclassified Streptomyces]|uniref:hypothetical protein n=1 Tax=unclassified Streptomyces TaxID=2593676 RepID=UPI0028880816|nr:hypothetical protein [Streptomyces sp. DSM 41633]